MKGLKSLLITTCLAASATNCVQADLISWTHDTYPVDGTIDGTSVVLGESNDFAYRSAWNAGSASNVTVNGVEFLANPTTTDVTITTTGSVSADIGGQSAGAFTGNFQTLMSTLKANTANGTQWNVVLDDLIEGEVYRAQFLSYQFVESTNERDMEIHFGTAIGDPGTGIFAAGNNGQTAGHSWTALFEADGTSQNFFIRSDSNDRSIINGVAVFQQVPEPTSLIVWSLCGGLGLLVWRWRAQH